ncbi:MAG: SseB family protein [Paracoccaceae bacterium]
MTDELTPLDRAHAAMEASPLEDAVRLRFYERLGDGELFLMLEAEAIGDVIKPRIFPVGEGQFALVFDREARLAEFAGGIAPYAAMSGRSVAQMLAGQGIGLGVNLGVAPSEILIPADAVDWLNETLGHAPQEVEARPEEISAPKGLPEALIVAMDEKLALAAGLARMAYLAGVRYEGGRRSHILGFVEVLPGAEQVLAQLAGEALTFSGVEAGEIDVAFFAASDPMCARLARVALRFDLPEPPRVQSAEVTAPGMDPERPPILR